MLLPPRIEVKGRNTPLGIQRKRKKRSQLVRQPAVPRGFSVLNRFLLILPRDPLTLLVERTVIRKRENLTSTRRSLSALSRLEICGRAHDVRSSGNHQNTRVRDSVSKAGHSNTAAQRVDVDGGHKVKVNASNQGRMADGGNLLK
jgi:hypothetical protein